MPIISACPRKGNDCGNIITSVFPVPAVVAVFTLGAAILDWYL
jgi:hypothetical protein